MTSKAPRRRSRAAVVAAAILLFQGTQAIGQERRADLWQDDSGYEIGFKRAELVIAHCLERASSTTEAKPSTCVHAVFQACEREHGTSQRDLNDCAAFSRSAWEKRLESVMSRLLGARTIEPKFGRAEPQIERLRESDRRWREWNVADCQLQAAGSEGGTMHRMEFDICLSDHAAHRALELEALTFWWGKAFKL